MREIESEGRVGRGEQGRETLEIFPRTKTKCIEWGSLCQARLMVAVAVVKHERPLTVQYTPYQQLAPSAFGFRAALSNIITCPKHHLALGTWPHTRRLCRNWERENLILAILLMNLKCSSDTNEENDNKNARQAASQQNMKGS